MWQCARRLRPGQAPQLWRTACSAGPACWASCQTWARCCSTCPLIPPGPQKRSRNQNPAQQRFNKAVKRRQGSTICCIITSKFPKSTGFVICGAETRVPGRKNIYNNIHMKIKNDSFSSTSVKLYIEIYVKNHIKDIFFLIPYST